MVSRMHSEMHSELRRRCQNKRFPAVQGFTKCTLILNCRKGMSRVNESLPNRLQCVFENFIPRDTFSLYMYL